MALTNATLSDLSDDHDDDYRLVLATDDARVDVTITEDDRETLQDKLAEDDEDDPFDL